MLRSIDLLERVITSRRLERLSASGMTAGSLLDFHTRHKLLILSHSTIHYQELGRLLAGAGSCEAVRLFVKYRELLMRALERGATRGKHTNVLHHALGYFKAQLTRNDKQALLAAIDCYRGGALPLLDPLFRIRRLVIQFRQPYLLKQVYFNPHPLQLQLLGRISTRRT